jgi:hypothetical protein
MAHCCGKVWMNLGGIRVREPGGKRLEEKKLVLASSCLLDSSKPKTCFSWSFTHSANTSTNAGTQNEMQLSSHLGEAQSSEETDTKLDKHISV